MTAKPMQKRAPKVTAPTPPTSVTVFIKSAVAIYPELNKVMKQQGFKRYMKSQGKGYLPKDTDFLPYLKTYLGKE